MFALVQFLVDKIKKIVPVQDIKDFNFDSYDSEISRAYEVFWQSPNGEGTGYWYAVVLVVAESEELIEQRKKRIKLPTTKRLEELLAMTLTKESTASEETVRKNKEIQEKRAACENGKLKEILQRKLKEKRKRSPSHSCDEGMMTSTPRSHRRNKFCSASDTSDEDDLVLKSELEAMKVEHDKVLRKLKLKQDENAELKKRNDTLQTLNISLQNQLLALLNANGGLGQNPDTENILVGAKLAKTKETEQPVQTNEGDSLFRQAPQEKPETCTDLVTGPCDEVVEAHKNAEPVFKLSNLETSNIHLHDNGSVMKWKDDKLELAPEIFISMDQWAKITASRNINHSRFTRNLAVSLWGSDTLSERSVTGMVCKRFKKDGVEAKKALTPIKVDAVQNGLRFWLKGQGKEEQEIEKLSAIANVRKMLADKIMDLTRRQKKMLNQTF